MSIFLLKYVCLNYLSICLQKALDLFEPLRYCVCYRKKQGEKNGKTQTIG